LLKLIDTCSPCFLVLVYFSHLAKAGNMPNKRIKNSSHNAVVGKTQRW
jgi:hypothetical protein